MSKLGKRYFFLQQLAFAGIGIDPLAEAPEQNIIKRPVLCFGAMICTCFYCLAVLHFAYVNINDFIEVTGALSLILESLLALWKMIIFLSKRKDFVKFQKQIHLLNLQAEHEELSIIKSENAKDFYLSSIYFTGVCCTTATSLLKPIFKACYVYFKSGALELDPPYKATYFWNYSQLSGYSIVYLWNCISLHFVGFTSMAVDSMFSWLISNILAQFRIVIHRFNKTASIIANDDNAAAVPRTVLEQSQAKYNFKRNSQLIVSCIEHHRRTLHLAAKLNDFFGEIIFIKFIISCLEICCLAFCFTRSNGSMDDLIHHGLFLSAVTVQLILYCYNAQRIKDESMEVASKTYTAFEWHHLARPFRKLLLLTMMRSQKSSDLKGVLFNVDLSLIVWVFKTAGSLIAALSTLEKNQYYNT